MWKCHWTQRIKNMIALPAGSVRNTDQKTAFNKVWGLRRQRAFVPVRTSLRTKVQTLRHTNMQQIIRLSLLQLQTSASFNGAAKWYKTWRHTREQLETDPKRRGSVKAPAKPVRTAPAAVWGRWPWRAACWPGTAWRGQDSPGTHRTPAALHRRCSSCRSEHKRHHQSGGRPTHPDLNTKFCSRRHRTHIAHHLQVTTHTEFAGL